MATWGSLRSALSRSRLAVKDLAHALLRGIRRDERELRATKAILSEEVLRSARELTE